MLLFIRCLLSFADYQEGPYCPHRKHRTTGSPMASRPTRTCALGGLRGTLAPPPLTSESMGMVSYAPTTFQELLDDEVESDGSSIGDVAPSHRPSQECAMADALGQLPVVAESL